MKNTSLDREQTKAVASITKALKTGNKTLVEMATGTGKTRTYVKYLKQNPKLRVLVLTHMNELVRQHIDTLKASGMQVGEYSSSVRETDKQITVASIPTLSRKNHFTKFSKKRFDLLVVDEAHHTPASSWKNLLDRFGGVKRLGLTATPFRPDGQQLNDYFGDISFSLPFKKAQEKRLVAKHEAWLVLNDSAIGAKVTTLGDYTKGALDRLVASKVRDTTIVSAYKKYGRGGMNKLGLKYKAICFCINTAHAARLSKRFNEAGITSKFLVGNAEIQSPSERQTIFAAFSSSHAVEVLCVVGIFNEGVDVPDIGCALMARPTRSNILYQQQIGRAARLLKGKKEQFIVLDFVDNVRTDFQSYTSSSLPGSTPLTERIITEYLKVQDPVVVEKRIKDIMSGVERFEAVYRAPTGHWTYERCRKEAKKYSGIKGWRGCGNASYQSALRQEFHLRIVSELGWNLPQKHSYETCIAEARKHKSSGAWAKAAPSSYTSAISHGYHEKICKELGFEVRKTREDYILDLLKLSKRPSQNGPTKTERSMADRLSRIVSKNRKGYNEDLHKLLMSKKPHWFDSIVRTHKKVKNLDTGKVYPSDTAASESIGRRKGAIGKAIKGGWKAGGYRWVYVTEKKRSKK